MSEPVGINYGQTWTERAGSRGARALPGEPLPPDYQSGFPRDYAAYLPEPGNVPAPYLITRAGRMVEGRKAHPTDDQNRPMLSMLYRLLGKIGVHGQKLTNYRVLVGVTETVLMPFNPMRAYLFLVNDGTQIIRVSFDRGADTISGIPIPVGGFFEPILGTVSSVRAISSVAGQSLIVIEGFYHWGAAIPAGRLPNELEQ